LGRSPVVQPVVIVDDQARHGGTGARAEPGHGPSLGPCARGARTMVRRHRDARHRVLLLSLRRIDPPAISLNPIAC
jgi:hypothetical protein